MLQELGDFIKKDVISLCIFSYPICPQIQLSLLILPYLRKRLMKQQYYKDNHGPQIVGRKARRPLTMLAIYDNNS